MSLCPGLKSFLFAALLSGLNVGCGAKLLADFDFSAPVASYDFSSAYATDEWLLQETSGAYANNKGGTALSVFTSGLQGQTAVGIWDGTSYTARKCWESHAVSVSKVECGDTATLDAGTSAVCATVVFARLSNSISRIFAKRNPGAPNEGYSLRFEANGALAAVVSDGTTTKTLVSTGTVFTDGAPHYAKLYFDRTTLYLKTDLGTWSMDASAVTGSLANTDQFTIGAWIGTTPAHLQISYVGGAVGANASAMYAEDFWKHATDPTGLLTTIDRNCTISVPVAADAVAHFAPDQLPIGYHSAFSDTNKLGLYCNSAVTNLIPYSEALSNWTGSGTTTTLDNQADAPDGFRSMSKITAGAINDFIKATFATTASTEYTLSCYIEESTVGVTGRVIFYDETGTAELASQIFTGSATPQIVKVTATTNVGQISSSMRIEIDNNAESVFAWGCEAKLGSWGANCPYLVRTSGAAASLVFSKYQSTLAPLNSLKGEFASTFVLSKFGPSGSYIFYTTSGGSIDNQVNHYTLPTGASRLYWVNNVGGPEANHSSSVHTAGAESTTRHLWDTAGLDAGAYETILYADGIRYNGGAMPLDGTVDDVTSDLVTLGSSGSAFPLDGIIQSIKSYDAPRAL